jgi:hypothetical protein
MSDYKGEMELKKLRDTQENFNTKEGKFYMNQQTAQGTTKEREQKMPRYDLIPKEWLDELASIFEEGAAKYGEDNWKTPAFFDDCLNHAMAHLLRFNNGDHSENQLPKVAWNVLAYRWFILNNCIGTVKDTTGGL